jgi:hypothetical protein
MGDLQMGDVVPMNNFTATYEHEDGDKFSFSYKRPGKDSQYLFLLLGVGTPERKVDANQALNAMGWVFDPERARELLTPSPALPERE